VARGNVVLGAMDDIDFLHPVKVGEVAVLRAQVEYVGRCSLEVGVRVYAEKPATGERALTLSSHLVFVKVDEHVKPLPVPETVVPRGADEEAMHAAAGERRARRLARFARRAERIREVEDDAPEQLRWRFESCRSVLPEDLLFGNTMFAGKLLLDIDEAGGILSMRYCRGLVMTACLDALDFYAPVHANEVVTFTASDFGRTFASNGRGSDHGWGGHHIVMGGAVRGARLYGRYPQLVLEGPDDTDFGRWIPSTSVDEYAATVARWFGVSASDMPLVFPNIGRFAAPNLGFLG
jgi:acyl-CoA hydrolase